MENNWTIDPEPQLLGQCASADLSNGDTAMKIRVGEIGGGLLSELRQRGNGAGDSTVVIPAGFTWKHASPTSGPLDNGATYIVVITDVGSWDTVAAILAEVGS